MTLTEQVSIEYWLNEQSPQEGGEAIGSGRTAYRRKSSFLGGEVCVGIPGKEVGLASQLAPGSLPVFAS